MINKIIFILILLSSVIQAKSINLTYYDIGAFKMTFIASSGEEKAIKLIDKAMKEPYFKQAYDKLNVEITKKTKTPDSIEVLNLLKKSNTLYAQWVGMNFYVLIRNRYSELKYIKQFAIPFSKKVKEANYCSGYIFYGSFLGRTGLSKTEQVKIYNEGMSQHCIGTKAEKFYLTVRRNNADRKK